MRTVEKQFLENFSKIYNRETGVTTKVEGLDFFLELEEQLFQKMFSFELTEAKQILRSIIDIIIARTRKNMILNVKYYYIQLSAVMARKLHESQVPTDKVMAFNIACVETIETKMSDAQFLLCADELVEFL